MLRNTSPCLGSIIVTKSGQWFIKKSTSLELLKTNLWIMEPANVECSQTWYKRCYEGNKFLPFTVITANIPQSLLWARHCINTPHVLNHLILTHSIYGIGATLSAFSDEEAEAQKGQSNLPKVTWIGNGGVRIWNKMTPEYTESTKGCILYTASGAVN